MSGNLFELRKDWPNPPTNNTVTATNSKPPIKIEPQEPDQPPPSATAPKAEQCRWGPNCPICKNAEEDWDGEHQKQSQQTPKTKKDIQAQDTQQKNSVQTHGKLKLRTLSAPKTTRYHKTPSPPRHNPSMYWTDMWSKSI